MGSDYQFGKVRDPSFSSYLNDADGLDEMKLAKLTRLGSGSEVRISADEEIGVFRADKYFNQGLESEEKHKELRSSVVEWNKDQLNSSPVRTKISLGTPSIRSESSSTNSQTALLQGFPTHTVPGRHSTGNVNRKKGFWSRLSCTCSCVSKKSLNVKDYHFNSEEHKEPRMNRADPLLKVGTNSSEKPWMKDYKASLDPLVTASLLPRAIGSSVLYKNHSPNLHKGVKEGSQGHFPTDSFHHPATGNIRKSISLERKLNFLNSDNLNTDAESDASSDLFEIDRFTGQRKPSFSSQIPDVSGYATPATCYAPSEASIDWSIVTASAVDFINMPYHENFKPQKPVPVTLSSSLSVTENHYRNNKHSIQSLMGFTNQKAERMLENTDSHKTRRS